MADAAFFPLVRVTRGEKLLRGDHEAQIQAVGVSFFKHQKPGIRCGG